MPDDHRSPDTPRPDEDTHVGAGGEVHQTARPNGEALTTQQGVIIADNQNSLRAGARGPLLMQDFMLREKIFHFDHERIPERVVHARGVGAHGVFVCTNAIPELTRAAPFQTLGKTTEVFTRFSTVAGSKGSMDLARDVRGFAVKFYTEEGNWDLVGNNIPVFFIQDPIKFPDLVHAVKPEPDRGFPQAQSAHDNFWDYISLTPESMHMVMWQMSDRTVPRSLRMIEGFGVHTFRFVNAAGEATFIKFHWRPQLGLQSVLWDEAVKVNGADPDYHRRDLWEAIQHGDHPSWVLAVQMFDQATADGLDFDILDPTKVIPEEDIPLVELGTMTLNRTVDNFFQETEQVAFCTQNVIPGIDFTDDPLLQGRNFSYLDTQLKRLGGPNFTQIPINAPRGCPVSTYQQDGHMQRSNRAGRVNYEPNGWGVGPREDPLRGYVSFAQPVDGPKTKLRPESFADHYSQARQFYISQTLTEQAHIQNALIFELSKCRERDIRLRIVSHLRNIEDGLAEAVARGLGETELPVAAVAAQQTRMDLAPSPSLSIQRKATGSFAGRVLGILCSDGASGTLLGRLTAVALEEGARVKLICPTIHGIVDDGGIVHPADEIVAGGKSVLFDAVAIVLGPNDAETLAELPAAQDFLRDAHAHCKFIGAQGADPLYVAGGIAAKTDAGHFDLSDADEVETFLQACRALRYWPREQVLTD